LDNWLDPGLVAAGFAIVECNCSGLEFADKLVYDFIFSFLLDLLENPEDMMTDAEELMAEELMADEQEVDIMTEHDCSGLELAERLPAAKRLPEDLRLRDLALAVLGILFSFPLGRGKCDFLSILLPLLVIILSLFWKEDFMTGTCNLHVLALYTHLHQLFSLLVK